MAVFSQPNNWITVLPEPLQAEIRKHMSEFSLDKGEHLYQRGAGAHGLYEVRQGFLQLKASGANGNEILITVYGPGTCLGEIPLLGAGERVFDAVAQSPVRVAMLPRAAFESLAARHPAIYQQLTTRLCQVVVRLLNRIEDTALLTLRQRLAKLLLSAAKTYGTPCDSAVVIDMPLTQADIGNILGVTRHSVQREFKQWRSEGILANRQRKWMILDSEALQRQLAP